jgi:hypothetical protein
MAGKPQVVLMMRHTEKSGDPSDPDRTAAGEARARALADCIQREFGAPDFIFAAALSKHGTRPYETVKPLADRRDYRRPGLRRPRERPALGRRLCGKAYRGVLAPRQHSVTDARSWRGQRRLPRSMGSGGLQFDLEGRTSRRRSKRRQRRGALLTIAGDGPFWRHAASDYRLLSGAGLPRSSVGTY